MFIQYKSPAKPIDKPYAETIYVNKEGKQTGVVTVQGMNDDNSGNNNNNGIKASQVETKRKGSDSGSQKSKGSKGSKGSNRQNRFIE